MFKNILNTFATRVVSSIVSFLLLILTTQYLGAYGRGILSLVIASMSILVLFNGFVGGTSLVYLIPKNKNKVFLKQVLGLSCMWALIVCFSGTFIFSWIGSIPKDMLIHILLLGILSSLLTIISLIFISHEKIFIYNISSLIQTTLNFFIFCLMILLLKMVTVNSFLIALYISYILVFLFVAFFMVNIWKTTAEHNSRISLSSTASEIAKYGFIAQVGNVIQYLNYRLSFFILNRYAGPADVGIYSVGVAISEMIWLIPGSIALVQYSKIANVEDSAYSKDLTVRLSKFSFLITFLCVIVLLFIPEKVLTIIFGSDFSQVKNIFIYLSVGISSFGFTVILSHYFAGTGRYKINTIAAFLGFIITIVGNFLLIPKYGYKGAGITASASYLATSLFLFLAFIKIADMRLLAFKLNRGDFDTFSNILSKIKDKLCVALMGY